MPTLHLLGTGAALSGPHRTTTMLAFADAGSALVVDCGGDVVQRLLAAGVALDDVEALLLTHEHPDHVSGFPLLIEKLWLAGRTRALPVHGPTAALGQARRLWKAFRTGSWKHVPPLEWHAVPLEPGASVLESAAWRVSAAPGVHPVPVIGIRVEHRASGSAVAYSADTQVCEPITNLARGARILVHEATGDFEGHSSPQGAAGVAAQAGAQRLILVHLPPEDELGDVDAARERFADLELGKDGARYEF